MNKDLVKAAAFDIIGDVHGCYDELEELLRTLGYRIDGGSVTPPDGRVAVFLGDLIDRGPKIVESARIAMEMVESGVALCVMGNHESQMLSFMRGETDRPEWGLPETLAQFAQVPREFTARFRAFSEGLPVMLLLDGGSLLVAHAGLPEALQNDRPEDEHARRWFALNGCYPEQGHRRANWGREYRGDRKVVYGHTPNEDPRWVNGTLCIDTGCVYGGSLTALRYPEMEVVSIEAKAVHYGW